MCCICGRLGQLRLVSRSWETQRATLPVTLGQKGQQVSGFTFTAGDAAMPFESSLMVSSQPEPMRHLYFDATAEGVSTET